MAILTTLIAVLMILLVLIDGFEAIILPRRVAHDFRFTRLYYRTTWPLWRFLARQLPRSRRQFGFLSVYGPLSLLGLFASWVALLIVGFALLHWSLGTNLLPADWPMDFGTYLYVSGVTFFTLGFADVMPANPVGRTLADLEAGGGFAFLAAIISYLPVLYQAFSRREVAISMLDARAGSPPSAG